MNKLEATAKLLNAYLYYRVVAKSFTEETGCSVCTNDKIQLSGTTGVNNRELAKILGVDVGIANRLNGWWEFSFTYQLVKFIWLEPATEAGGIDK